MSGGGTAAQPAGPASAILGESATFAPVGEGPSFARSPFATAVAQAAILIVAVVAVLRILVWQASKSTMTPFLYVAIAFLLVIGAWLLIDASALAPRMGN